MNCALERSDKYEFAQHLVAGGAGGRKRLEKAGFLRENIEKCLTFGTKASIIPKPAYAGISLLPTASGA